MRLFVVCMKNMMGLLQIQVKQLFNIKTSDKKTVRLQPSEVDLGGISEIL